MMRTAEELSDQGALRLGRVTPHRLKQKLARIGYPLFRHRLAIGLGVTAVAAPFVRPTRATTPFEVRLKAGGFCLVLTGLGVRGWAAGCAGRHTRSATVEGSKLASGGPYAYVRNPIYLGSIILGLGMVLLIGDRRLFVPCALTFLGLYAGLIPAEEEFLSQQFPDEYRAYCRHVPRLRPRLTAWPGAVRAPFDWRAGCGEWRLSLILALIRAAFRVVAAS